MKTTNWQNAGGAILSEFDRMETKKTVKTYANRLTELVAESTVDNAQKQIAGKIGNQVKYLHDYYYGHPLNRYVKRYTQKHYQTGRLHDKTAMVKISEKDYEIGTDDRVQYGDFIVALDLEEIGISHLEAGLKESANQFDKLAKQAAQEVLKK